MKTPNNIGFVTEVQEDRQVGGAPHLRFKLRLRNTLGLETTVMAVLENSSKAKEIADFFQSEIATAPVVISNRTIEELANQLDADLSGAKDAHDNAVDALTGAKYKTRAG
jgi:hypothetical protein